METSREDVGIAIRSAFLRKGTQQRFSLIILIIFSVILLYLDSTKIKPIDFLRSFIKDVIYRGSLITSYPSTSFDSFVDFTKEHIYLHKNYKVLKEENKILKNEISESDFLQLENTQLRKLIDEQVKSSSNLVSARVMIDKQSPYLNSL